MALDGILLNKLVIEIKKELPARINKIYQISSTEILFQLKTQQGKKNFLVSCHSIYNRISLTTQSYPTPYEPSNFVMLLRKYLESSKIVSIVQGELDRWVRLDCSTRNELGDPVSYHLFIELMGKYANLIFTDSSNKILDALKRIPPFENNRRTIQPGAIFKETEVQKNKVDPFSSTTFDPERTLVSQFHGFSPLLSKEVEYRLQTQSFQSIMNEIKNSDSLFIHPTKNDVLFHCIPLTHIGKGIEKPLLSGMDTLYFEQEEKERIKDLIGDLYRFVRRTLKHYKQKLPKLQQSYEDALDCDKWRQYGDLLFSHQSLQTKGLNKIELPSWEDESLVTIPLDPKLDLKGNAKKCFQTYNKRKKGQLHIEKQIELCQKEIDYFEGLEEQLEFSNFKDATEIQEELIHLGYIQKKNKHKKQKKKKESLPSITKWTLENGVTLSFGKNNLQNDALTFKIANKSDLWFHTKDFHGAHVTLSTLTPDEETLRLAAMVAAYFSKGRYSSSVPVNYCPVKNLKRIPGAKPGMVALSSYKTIYIDPDFELIEAMNHKNS